MARVGTEGLDALVAQMWEAFAPLVRSRLEVLEEYAAALSDGQDPPALRVSAGAAAHKLAGALGSYGRGGSEQASQLDALLRAGAPPPLASEVSCLVSALRAAVEA